MMKDSSAVRLELDSRPERVALVRGMLVGLGGLLAWDAVLVDDLKTAVSEACNNVVLHAYGGACVSQSEPHPGADQGMVRSASGASTVRR